MATDSNQKLEIVTEEFAKAKQQKRNLVGPTLLFVQQLQHLSQQRRLLLLLGANGQTGVTAMWSAAVVAVNVLDIVVLLTLALEIVFKQLAATFINVTLTNDNRVAVPLRQISVMFRPMVLTNVIPTRDVSVFSMPTEMFQIILNVFQLA